MMINTIQCTLYFDTNLFDLDLGHKVSTKQNLSASCFLHFSSNLGEI